jgi:hypothetical protein
MLLKVSKTFLMGKSIGSKFGLREKILLELVFKKLSSKQKQTGNKILMSSSLKIVLAVILAGVVANVHSEPPNGESNDNQGGRYHDKQRVEKFYQRFARLN